MCDQVQSGFHRGGGKISQFHGPLYNTPVVKLPKTDPFYPDNNY